VSVESVERVVERICRLYGEDPAEATGVLHVAAVWQRPEGELRVIRIGPGCPTSETDTFVLRVARMRAQAILTTGRILRAEPDLNHRESSPALRRWRRERVGLDEPPRTVVLTSGRELDLHHGALQTAHRPVVVTSEAAAGALESAARSEDLDLEVIGRAQPGIRDALGWLRSEGCRTILVEAGPTTATSLYDSPAGVDELLLSVLHAPSVEDRWIGPRFPSLPQLETLLDEWSEPTVVEEPSGRWTFHRLGRPAPSSR